MILGFHPRPRVLYFKQVCPYVNVYHVIFYQLFVREKSRHAPCVARVSAHASDLPRVVHFAVVCVLVFRSDFK